MMKEAYGFYSISQRGIAMKLQQKQIGYLLFIVGLVAAVLSILIDPIRGYDIYLATGQIVVLIVGIVVALVGLYLAFVRKSAT